VLHRWLVFVHQLPAHPSNGRVKTWRRLQQVGAVAMKNAVHVLPDSAQSREDFEWLRAEVAGLGGQAAIFTAAMSDSDEKQVIAQFQAASAAEFSQLRKEIRTMKGRTRTDLSAGLSNANGLPAVRALQERFDRAVQRDVFSAPGSREVESALKELDAEYRPSAKSRSSSSHPTRLDAGQYKGRVWVTRPRPGVDRFSSAWLIRRFIDRDARFVFATSPEKHPDAVPFDMYQSGGFKHEGEMCTFEVLQERFGIRDVAVRRIAEIVHDIDLKEERYKSPHAPTVAHLVEGLRASTPDDARLLEQGINMFEALYLSFGSGKPQRPRRPQC
jgi:hypothetical protein